MVKTSPIVIIDSGVGGLYVYQRLKEHLPYENFIYFADNAFFPYGEKTQEALSQRGEDLLETAKIFHPKQVIIACNTLSLSLKAFESNIITMQKSIDQTEAMFKEARVLSTHLASQIRKEKALDAGTLAVDIENQKPLQRSELFPKETKTVILGCTHYSWIIKDLERVYPEIQFIDPTQYVVQQVIQSLKERSLLSSSNAVEKDRFFSTKDPSDFHNKARYFLWIDDVEPLKVLFKSVAHPSNSFNP